MGKKVLHVFLFLAVLAASITMTIFTGNGQTSTLIYNFSFLAVIAAIYLTGMFGGMFRIDGISKALKQGAQELTEVFKVPGKVKKDSLDILKGIFGHGYLDEQMDKFIENMDNSEEGIGEIEEYIGEEEIDLHVHKKLLELAPDIFTSIGILGTFVGLVWGLKNFEPSSYETMTNSVASLVNGIKVAFLTSIYGIAFSIIYTSGMKSTYSDMSDNLQHFLEKFHAYVIPTAENESRNLMVASQKLQTKAMKDMADQLSVQMAESFEKALTPTFRKLNDSLDVLTQSVTKCQQEAIQEILDTFMKEMNNSFHMQFGDFNEALEQLKKAQKQTTDYTTNLYHTVSQQLSDSYQKQSDNMRDLLRELGNVQAKYMNTATKIAQDNQEIQKNQQQDYQRVADYLHESEKTSAKFWVACNQTMQKYVETAAQGMEKASAANQMSTDVLQSNKRVVEDLDAKLQEFICYQQLTCKTLEEVQRLFADIAVVRDNHEVYLTPGQLNQSSSRNSERNSLEQIRKLLEAQGERQEELMEEITRGLRELSKTSQKGKFGFFK